MKDQKNVSQCRYNILGKKCGREECLTYIFFLTKLTDQSVSDYRAHTISNNAMFKEDIAALKANAKYWRSKMIGSRRLDKKKLTFASSGTDYTLHALHTYVSD